MRKINTYEKSRAAFERAVKVIPSGIYGHQGPAEGCYVPVEAFPLYSSKAEGTYLWDLDGNRFIDYMCAYGPNILGYHDPDVDAAAARQRAISDCTTLPNTVMIDFADLQTARDLFDGNINAIAAVGMGQVRICGMISQVDNINRILDRVSIYLA